jgi:hypothetical protein
LVAGCHSGDTRAIGGMGLCSEVGCGGIHRMVNLGVSELLCAVMKLIIWILLSNTRKLVASAAARMLAYGCMVMGMYIISRLCECKAAAATQQ